MFAVFRNQPRGYMDYAMNEYAFRFWVKPMSKEKLKFGLESAVKRLENNNKCIEFNTDRNVVNIPINKIIFIMCREQKDDYCYGRRRICNRPTV